MISYSKCEALLWTWLQIAISQRFGYELSGLDAGRMLELDRSGTYLLNQLRGNCLLLITLEVGECGACKQGQGNGGSQGDEAVHGRDLAFKFLCE